MRYLIHHILFILLIVADALAGYWMVTQPGAIRSLAFALHLVVAFSGVKVLQRIKLKNFEAEDNFSYVGFGLAAVLPVYGLLGMYVTAWVMSLSKFVPISSFEENDPQVPERYRSLLRCSDFSLASLQREEMDIESFRDIFRTNDPGLEENAIQKLSKILTHESVSILQEVVQHACSDTKVLAATALIEMEDKLVEKIESLRGQLAEDSRDTKLMLELARIYDVYCYLGVLDNAIEDYYRGLAIEQYRTFLIYDPRHPEATLEYGRTLLNAGDLEKALRVLNSAVRLDPVKPNPYIWLAEAHYKSGDYLAVTDICKKINSFQNLPENFKPITSWWAEDFFWSRN